MRRFCGSILCQTDPYGDGLKQGDHLKQLQNISGMQLHGQRISSGEPVGSPMGLLDFKRLFCNDSQQP